LQGIHEAVEAFAAAAWFAERRAEILRNPPDPIGVSKAANEPVSLDEHSGKQLIAGAGLAVPRGQVCRSAGVVATAQQIGFPVAIKMLSLLLPHKTEAGAVALSVCNARAATDAVEKMRARVLNHAPEALTDHFLVEEMIGHPVAELLVSVRSEPQFGAVLTIASGGVLTELVEDAVTLLLPTGKADIDRALGRLKVATLIDGYRGQVAGDRRALVTALTRLADYAVTRRDEISQIEINPLFVLQDGVCAVDALVAVRVHETAAVQTA
jgi:succinyl-CoA synthetase beta subunit